VTASETVALLVCPPLLRISESEVAHSSQAHHGELKKIEGSLENKQEWYSGLLYMAHEKGRSEGWAAHTYRAKFNVWPRGLDRIPRPPTPKVISFEHSRRIAYAKGRAKGEARV
jgi:hypothetical protein